MSTCGVTLLTCCTTCSRKSSIDAALLMNRVIKDCGLKQCCGSGFRPNTVTGVYILKYNMFAPTPFSKMILFISLGTVKIYPFSPLFHLFPLIFVIFLINHYIFWYLCPSGGERWGIINTILWDTSSLFFVRCPWPRTQAQIRIHSEFTKIRTVNWKSDT